MANPQYPAVKLIHYAASRRLELPLALTKLVLYLAFLGKERNTAGAMTLAHASTICSLDGIAVGVYDTSKVDRYHRDSETAQPPPGQEGSGPHAGHDQRHHPQVWPSRTTTSSRLGRPCEHQPFDAPVRGAAAPAARAGELLGRRIGKHSEAAVRRFDDKFATRAIVRALACRCLSWKWRGFCRESP